MGDHDPPDKADPTNQDATPVTKASSSSTSSARFVRRPATTRSCHRTGGKARGPMQSSDSGTSVYATLRWESQLLFRSNNPIEEPTRSAGKKTETEGAEEEGGRRR